MTGVQTCALPIYDGLNNIDLHLSRRLTVETATVRILAEIVMAANGRLYITTAETGLNIPPPAVFQASLQILDNDGVRIRTRTNLGQAEGINSPISAGGVFEESDKVAAQATGSWRVAGSSCQAVYFKSGTRAKSKRDENVLNGTVSNNGTTFNGQLILNGSREGQFINPMTDLVIMIFDPSVEGKLSVSALGAPATGWPDVTLERCAVQPG